MSGVAMERRSRKAGLLPAGPEARNRSSVPRRAVLLVRFAVAWGLNPGGTCGAGCSASRTLPYVRAGLVAASAAYVAARLIFAGASDAIFAPAPSPMTLARASKGWLSLTLVKASARRGPTAGTAERYRRASF